jgi:hypothetical protein
LGRAKHCPFIERQPVDGCDLATTAAEYHRGRIVAAMCEFPLASSLVSLTHSLAVGSTTKQKNVIFLFDTLKGCDVVTFQEVDHE